METVRTFQHTLSFPPARTLDGLKVRLRATLRNAPLLIATFREPVVISENRTVKHPAGGVSQALHALLSQIGGHWIAVKDSFGPETLSVRPEGSLGYRLHRLDVPDDLRRPFYEGYSNGVLWPLFHSNLERVFHCPSDFQHYDTVNRHFARKIAETTRSTRPGLIWIHDYQLLRVGHWLRKERTALPTVAFFCHIPWPAPDEFFILPEHMELLEGLLGYDVIGFQTEDHRAQFLATVGIAFPGSSIDEDGTIRIKKHRVVQTTVSPVGIDSVRFREMAREEGNLKSAREFLGTLGLDPLFPFVISVDRMDYTKGLMERIDILDAFFTRFPQWREKISFLQIAPPTRTGQSVYRDFQDQLRARIRGFNIAWSTESWTPIVTVESTLQQNLLSGLYRLAQGALVTSSQDGMNLVAQEFVAAQAGEGGTLFLSRYAGSSQFLKNAIPIDPFAPDDAARRIHAGLSAPLEQRLLSMSSMNRQIDTNNIYRWISRFLEAIPETTPPSSGIAPLPRGIVMA